MAKAALSATMLREKLDYDPASGLFRWKATRGRARAGAVAGCICPTFGYRIIGFNGRLYRGARLAWLFMTGEWPPAEVDHRDHDRANDAWNNLRPATRAEQQCNRRVQSNNACGFKGVQLHRETGKWRARIAVAGRTRSLGLYATPEEAHRAYAQAAAVAHGQFAQA